MPKRNLTPQQKEKLRNPALTQLFLKMKPIPRIELTEAEKKQMEKNKD